MIFFSLHQRVTINSNSVYQTNLEWFGPKFDYTLSLSENKYAENLLETSTGVKEYGDAISSWMERELKDSPESLYYWFRDQSPFDLKNHCDDNIDQKVEVCRDNDWFGHKSGQTFYKRSSGKYSVSPLVKTLLTVYVSIKYRLHRK